MTTKTDALKQIGNASLYIKGVNSEAALRGTSAGRLFFDELDAWTERQQYMAEERASGQKDGDKIVWGFSTPRYPNCGIHKQYQNSTANTSFLIARIVTRKSNSFGRIRLRFAGTLLTIPRS